MKIRASTQHYHSPRPAVRLTPCPSGAGAGISKVRQSHGARSRANPGWYGEAMPLRPIEPIRTRN